MEYSIKKNAFEKLRYLDEEQERAAREATLIY